MLGCFSRCASLEFFHFAFVSVQCWEPGGVWSERAYLDVVFSKGVSDCRYLGIVFSKVVSDCGRCLSPGVQTCR